MLEVDKALVLNARRHRAVPGYNGVGENQIYVSVPESNKLHGLDHEKKELDHVDIKCYGGLTFSGAHPLLYLGEERYWLGFDAMATLFQSETSTKQPIKSWATEE